LRGLALKNAQAVKEPANVSALMTPVILAADSAKSLLDLPVQRMSGARQNYNQMGEHLRAKVQEVYQFLRPSNHWKGYATNDKSLAAGVGRKIILGWTVEHDYSAAKGFRICYNKSDELRAVDQVFHMLDGKMANGASWQGGLGDAICNQTGTRDGVYSDQFETPYFKGRCFANRNLHLEFKRQDLLDKFNLIAGGYNLTDAKAA
jgi:hypothetical protein